MADTPDSSNSLPLSDPKTPYSSDPLPFPDPKTSFQRYINTASIHSEMIAFVLFSISLIIWLFFIPRPGKPYQDPSFTGGLCKAMAPNNKPDAKAQQTECDKTICKDAPNMASCRKSFDVWSRYEEDYSHFIWGEDINLYLYNSLKTLAIILSAITPALIVAPSLKNKKILAALPAVVVAVATGLIGEFDFKDEAARFDNATVQLQTEKSLFVTSGGPFYQIQPLPIPGGTPQSSPQRSASTPQTDSPNPTQSATSQKLSLVLDSNDAPFLPPHDSDQAQANFIYRIEKIRQDVAAERDQFLRGRNSQNSVSDVSQKPKLTNPVPGPRTPKPAPKTNSPTGQTPTPTQ